MRDVQIETASINIDTEKVVSQVRVRSRCHRVGAASWHSTPKQIAICMYYSVTVKLALIMHEAKILDLQPMSHYCCRLVDCQHGKKVRKSSTWGGSFPKGEGPTRRDHTLTHEANFIFIFKQADIQIRGSYLIDDL